MNSSGLYLPGDIGHSTSNLDELSHVGYQMDSGGDNFGIDSWDDSWNLGNANDPLAPFSFSTSRSGNFSTSRSPADEGLFSRSKEPFVPPRPLYTRDPSLTSTDSSIFSINFQTACGADRMSYNAKTDSTHLFNFPNSEVKNVSGSELNSTTSVAEESRTPTPTTKH